jgi:hypothetical protein
VCTHNGQKNGLQIAVFTGDHCPPHLHVDGIDWVAKFEFSFTDNNIKIINIIPEGTRVSTSIVSTIINSIHNNINKAREAWWNCHSDVCINNKCYDTSTNSISTISTTKNNVRISSSIYLPKAKKTEITLSNGNIVGILL